MSNKVMECEWQYLTIGEVCTSVSDTYSGKDEKVVLINTSDVFDGNILNHKVVPNINLKGQFKKTFEKDDILYSEIRPANRRYAYVDLLKTDNYIASTKFMVIRANRSKIRPRFLYALLKSKDIIIQLQNLAETRSGTFPQITFGAEVAPIKINLPSFEVQDRIIAILDSIDKKIENNNAVNRNLQAQAEALFNGWFITFEHFNNRKPKEWYYDCLGNISKMSVGGDKPKIFSAVKTNICAIPVFSNGVENEGLYGYTDKAKIEEESVTVSARGTIGYVCLRGEPYLPIVRLITLVPKNEVVSAKYLYLWLLQSKICGTGSTQQQLTVPDFQKQEVLVPSYSVMREFTLLISPLYKQITANKCENKRLATLRDTLLPKLMSGEIDASRVEI